MFRFKKMCSLAATAILATGLAVTMAACSDDDDDQSTLYERLGEADNIAKVVADFRGRVVADNEINGFFSSLTADDVARLDRCLVKQIGSVTGGPQTYPSETQDPEADDEDKCRNMTQTHTGMELSNQDFDTLAKHLVEALEDAGVAAADVTTIVDTVTPIKDVIVGI